MRLAYVSEAPVNWCPALGTVLANEEVIDGKSEVGGHPVERRPLRQWMLRITAYAERLLDELEGLDWPESIKLLQRNWIGRSEGAEVHFTLAGRDGDDHRFHHAPGYALRRDLPGARAGASAGRLAHRRTSGPRWPSIASAPRARATWSAPSWRRKRRGVFTGAFAINPVNGESIPIWIADYVLLGYGTGAIMAVPAHDERDWEFADEVRAAHPRRRLA